MNAQGKWNVTIDTPMGRREGVLDLAVEGSTLSGAMTDGEHSAAISGGTIKGNQLEWSAKLTKPMRMTVKFTATISEDRMVGKAKHLLGSLTFEGRRA